MDKWGREAVGRVAGIAGVIHQRAIERIVCNPAINRRVG
jgi:hypothetical protein